MKNLFIAFVIFTMLAISASAASIHVGSGYTYATPQAGIAAASAGDTVYIHSGTYSISTTIAAASGVSLIGDGVNKTIIKAASSTAGNSSTYPALIYVSGKNSITIANMSVLGYYTNKDAQHDNSGHNDYGIGINVRGSSSNITIHDVYMDMLTGDGIKISSSTNVNMYNCKITTSGHDGVCFYASNYCWLNNSYIDLMTNTGIRYDGASNCWVKRTTFIQSLSGSGAGYVELENTLSNCSVTKCAFLQSSDPVVWLASADGGTVGVYDNIIYNAPAMSSSYSPYTGTFTNNTRYTTSYDWKAWGYGYDSAATGSGSMPVYNGSVLPSLLTPIDGQTLHTTNGKLTFSWFDVNSTQYKVYVASDSGFTTNLTSNTTTSPSISIPLDNGTYYWKIQAHKDTDNTWTANTSSQNFTINGNDLVKVGAYGVIYDTTTDNPIKGAVVTLMNDSWSETQVTNDDGFYSFIVPANSDIYYISAIATDYIGTVVAAGSGLPLNMSENYYEKNIALTRSPSYYNPHVVTFTVVGQPGGILCEGALVSLYLGDSDTASFSSETDSYGKVAFKLDEDKQYRIVVRDDEKNIEKERTITVSESRYEIWVDGTNLSNNLTPDDTPKTADDYIGYGITVTDHNLTYSNVNQTILSRTTDNVSYTTIIRQIYSNNTTIPNGFNTTVTGNTSNISFAIAVPVNGTYFVQTTVNHPAYVHTYTKIIEIESFDIRPEFDFGWENKWNYEVLGYILVLLAAGLFGQRNMKGGILAVLGIAWFNQYTGWWQYDTTGTIFLTLATVLGFGYIVTRED